MFQRYAIYYTPEAGPFEDFGARWLGRDLRRGVDLPAQGGAVTDVPRRYGFHATLKAPFALTEGATEARLRERLRRVAAANAPVSLPGGLQLVHHHGFLALMPVPQPRALADLAASMVRDFDSFRAPLTPADRARRNPDALPPRQREQLDRWGYPWIFGDFRFHMTLSDRLADPAPVMAQLRPLLAEVLETPFTVTQISLVGEDADKRFHLIEEVRLGG